MFYQEGMHNKFETQFQDLDYLFIMILLFYNLEKFIGQTSGVSGGRSHKGLTYMLIKGPILANN